MRLLLSDGSVFSAGQGGEINMLALQIIETLVAPGIVRRSDRGLYVARKRITLYLIMDYLKAGWPPRLLRHQLRLSEEEMNQVMNFLDSHRAEFECYTGAAE